MRYHYLNTISYNIPNILNNENNIQLNYDNNSQNNVNSNEFDQFNYIENIDENKIDMGKYNAKFNANRYINAVKDRLENGKKIYYDNYKIKENKFDILQERQYIKKCNRDYHNK